MLLIFSRRTAWCLALVVLVACSLRIWQIDRWLPEFYEEATPVLQARAFWGGERFDFNPHFFNYPALGFYAQFVVQAGVFVWLRATGQTASLDEFRLFLDQNLPAMVLLGRVVTALLDVGTVVLIFLLGRRIANNNTGLLAAVLLACNALHVRMSQYVLVDVPLTFFSLLTLLWTIDIIEKGQRYHFIKVGVALGLAASTKYTAGLLAVPVMVAAHWGAANRVGRVCTYRRLGVTAAVSLVVFVLLNPYSLLDFDAFWADFSYEHEHMQVGHFGHDPSRSTAALYAGNLAWSVGIVGVAGLWGVASCFRRRHVSSLLFYGWVVLYLVILSTWKMHGERYLMPAVPLVLLLGARAVTAIEPKKFRTWAIAVFLMLYLLPQVYLLTDHYRSVSAIDTRQRVGDWVDANVARGSLIAIEHYSYYPDRLADDLLLFRLPFDIMHPDHFSGLYALGWYENFDYVLVSSFIYQRYLANPDRFAKQLEFYRQLREKWQMVQHFRPHSGPGPEILIYRNPLMQRPDEPFPVALYQGVRGIQLDLLGQFFADLEFVLRERGYAARAASVEGTWALIERWHIQ